MNIHCSVALKSTLFLSALISITSVGQLRTALPRITQGIDNTRLTTLRGNVHPLARAEFDRGRAPDSMPVRRMLLLLSRSDEQEKSLHHLLDAQQTVGSADYHKWLTPEEFGQTFGPTDVDVQTVTTWLLNSGLHVDNVSSGRGVIEFSGTAGQLRQVFRTELHNYVVGTEAHWANANDPQIPEALAPVVKGFLSLNDFPRKAMSHSYGRFTRDSRTGQVTPLYTLPTTAGTYYALGPGDIQVIYNSAPLIQAGTDGAGQTIAVVGRTNIHLEDITDFRNMFGLSNTPNNHTSVLLNGPDPGIVRDEFEALLDLEWAGASAPGASIVLVASQSTETTSGIDLSALYIVENNLAPVMSVSYGSCEFYLGNAGNQFFHNLWEQAAAQGITVVVSSGDNGSAGCDNQNLASAATHGLAVSGLASTAFNIAAGGTDFNDAGSQTAYFNPTNAPTTLTSAKSYVPEMTWNDTCAGGPTPNLTSCTSSSNLQLWSGSGGPSNCSSQSSGGVCLNGTAKPSWQAGSGVPADGVRDIPDISFFSAIGSSGSNSFYVVCKADEFPGSPSCQPSRGYYFLGAGGTSAAAPIFAGAVALANQKTGSRLGNVNYLLYSIAAKSGASCATTSTSSSCIFRDVTMGGISVPCAGGSPSCSATTSGTKGVLVDSSNQLAYMAGTGYDRATGLGSVNITNLVNAIVTAKAGYTATATALTLNGGTSQLTSTHGASVAVGVSVSPAVSTGDVSLIGNNRGIDGKTLNGGAANWNTTLLPGGNYMVQAHYAGDGTRAASDSNSVPVSISPESSTTFTNLVTFDLRGNLLSFAATNTTYGAPYILRMDVGDAGATVSPTLGISSKCANGTASCPTGTLTLTANGTSLDGGNFPLNGAGYTRDRLVQLTPGTYNLLATYPGDASYSGSSGGSTISISKAPTTVTANLAPTVPYGTLTNIQVIVNSNSNGAGLGGNLSFTLDGNPLYMGGNYLVLQPPPLYQYIGFSTSEYFNSLGAHTFASQYSGDTNYLASSSQPVAFTVTQARTAVNPFSATPNPGVPQYPVTLSVNITTDAIYSDKSPTGTVTFYDNGAPLSTTINYVNSFRSIIATTSYTFSQLGTHNLTASYSGDTYYLPVSTSSPLPLTIQQKLVSTGKSLLASNYSPAAGLPVKIDATFAPQSSGPPLGGTVTFTDAGSATSETVTYPANANPSWLTAEISHTFITIGTHNIVAQYNGDANYLSSQLTGLSLSVVSPFLLTLPISTTPIGAAGGSGSSTVSVSPNGGFTGQVTLTCSSAPATATCSTNPTSVTLNGAGATATLNYTIPALSARVAPQSRPALGNTAGPLMVGGCFGCFVLGLPGLGRRRRIIIALSIVLIAFGTAACGGGGGGGAVAPPPKSQTYVLTVTGTGSDGTVATTTLTVTQM